MDGQKRQVGVADAGKITGEMHFTLRDKDGNVKKLWNTNKIGLKLLSFFRSIWADPIDDNGQVKRGIGNYLSAYGLRIPLLFGKWDKELALNNLVVNAGLAGVSSRINGSGGEAAFTYLAVGTGTTGAAAGDTTLETEIVDSGLERASATVSRETTTVSNDTATLDKTWSVTGTKAITEGGALNAAAAGTLLGRQTFSAVNVANGDTFELTYKFAVS